MKNTYSEKLLDPRWQKKRLEVLGRDNFACLHCYDDKLTLHVHHLYYCKDREPWDYPLWALVTLCKDCHSGQTIYDDDGNYVPTDWELAIGWIANNSSWNFSTFLWDLGAEIAQMRTDGAPYSFIMGAMMDSLKALRKRAEEEEAKIA